MNGGDYLESLDVEG